MSSLISTSTYPAVAGNYILAGVEQEEFYRLTRFSKLVYLEAQQTLYAPGDEITHVYFPAGSVVTSVVVMNDGSTVETAMMGRDGVAGVATVAGSYRARRWMKVLLPGDALRVEAHVLRELFNESPTLKRLMLRYYAVLVSQVSRRALCNSHHRLNERLATWLLMLQDRAGRDDLPLTQEAAARQLGVRRAGVNECVGWLQRRGVLDHRRGHVGVLHRPDLEEAACVCYREYEKEMSWQSAARN